METGSLKPYVYVLAIAEHGTITKASQSLDVAQSTLSRYLRKLENELEVQLFDRSTIPIKLTAAGKIFVEASRYHINIERQLHKQMQQIRCANDITIRIGISPSRAPYLLPLILKEFHKISSSRVFIEEHGINVLNDMLTKGDIDLNFSHLNDDTLGFTRIELFDERMMLALPSNIQKSSYDELFNVHPVISLPKETRTGNILRDILLDHPTTQPTINCSSIDSALAMVGAGLGITIVPSFIAKFGFHSDLKYIPLSEAGKQDLESTKFCLFYRRNQYLTEADEVFIECAQRVLKED